MRHGPYRSDGLHLKSGRRRFTRPNLTCGRMECFYGKYLQEEMFRTPDGITGCVFSYHFSHTHMQKKETLLEQIRKLLNLHMRRDY